MLKYLELAISRVFILVILILVVNKSELKSQEGFSLGLKAGAGYSQFFFQKPVNQIFTLVFQKGAVISYRDEKNFGIQLEIMQTQKAWEEDISKTFKKRVAIDYYEFPILSTYKFGKKGSGLTITGGLHISYAFGTDSSTTGQMAPGDTSIVPYSPFVYNKWDYGLQGGAGYQFMFGRNIVQLELMFSQSLQNFFDRNYKTIRTSLNQNLYFNLVYKFSLAGRKKQNVKI